MELPRKGGVSGIGSACCHASARLEWMARSREGSKSRQCTFLVAKDHQYWHWDGGEGTVMQPAGPQISNVFYGKRQGFGRVT